jgi:hypothetical protein
MDWFKKSFLELRSAFGNLVMTASRAVLESGGVQCQYQVEIMPENEEDKKG